MEISINIDATCQHITSIEQEVRYARLLVEQLQKIARMNDAIDELDPRICHEALRKAEMLEMSIHRRKKEMQELVDQMRYIKQRNREDIEAAKAFVDRQIW